MDELPAVRDPEPGWFATATQLNLPDGYPHTVTYDWDAPFRHERIAEVLGSRTGWTVADCVRLQTDYVSLPARRIQPLLSGLTSDDADISAALDLLRRWDATLSADSGAAALFEVWYRRQLRPAVLDAALTGLVPPDRRAQALARVLPAEDQIADARVDLRLMLSPGDRVGPPGTLPKIMLSTLADAIAELLPLLHVPPRRRSWPGSTWPDAA